MSRRFWDNLTFKTFALLDKYQEFIAIVKALWISKLILSIVSIAAGFFFVYGFLIGFIPKPVFVAVMSLAILVALEALNFYLPLKYFKFALNPPELLKEHNYFNVRKIKRFLFITSLIGFSISFYTSSQGARMFAHRADDHSADIAKMYEARKASINAKFDDMIQNLQEEKKKIENNPTRYRAGGREPTLLSSEQLARIAEINKQIIGLEKQRQDELRQAKEEYRDQLKLNQQGMRKTGWEYFAFAAGLIILLNLINYFIVYFSKIIKLSLIEDEDEQRLEQYKERMKQLVFNMAENDLSGALNKFSSIAQKRKPEPPKSRAEKQVLNNFDVIEEKEEFGANFKDILQEQGKQPEAEKKVDLPPEIYEFAQNKADVDITQAEYEDFLNFYRKNNNVFAQQLLEKYPDAVRMLIERERTRKKGRPTISMDEISERTNVGRTTLYKLLTLIRINPKTDEQ